MRLPFVVTALAAFAACGDITEPAPTPSGDVVWASSPAEVWLAVGDEVRVDSLLRVGFTRVLSDSRCPSLVICIWEGDAAVGLATGIGMGPSYPDTLHTTLDPRAMDFGGYYITLLELAPYPAASGPIPDDVYSIHLRIERMIR